MRPSLRKQSWFLAGALLLALATMGPSAVLAQTPGRFSADFGLGWNHGSGSDYANADWNTARVAVAARFWRTERAGGFVEMGVEVPSGTNADYAPCGFLPRGATCAPDFPRYGGASLLVGAIAAPTPLTEARVGVGPAYVVGELGAGSFALTASADLALMLLRRVGVVGAIRGVAVPHSMDSSLVFNMVSLGFRIR